MVHLLWSNGKYFTAKPDVRCLPTDQPPIELRSDWWYATLTCPGTGGVGRVVTPSGVSAPVLELMLNDARLADCGAPIHTKLPAWSVVTLPEKGASRLLSMGVPVGNGDPATADNLPSVVLPPERAGAATSRGITKRIPILQLMRHGDTLR
jgi:hypothetical protein